MARPGISEHSAGRSARRPPAAPRRRDDHGPRSAEIVPLRPAANRTPGAVVFARRRGRPGPETAVERFRPLRPTPRQQLTAVRNHPSCPVRLLLPDDVA